MAKPRITLEARRLLALTNPRILISRPPATNIKNIGTEKVPNKSPSGPATKPKIASHFPSSSSYFPRDFSAFARHLSSRFSRNFFKNPRFSPPCFSKKEDRETKTESGAERVVAAIEKGRLSRKMMWKCLMALNCVGGLFKNFSAIAFRVPLPVGDRSGINEGVIAGG